MTTTKQPTGLLDLPPEIWSKIGRLVVDEAPNLSVIEFALPLAGEHQPSITRTSRVIREELLPYFYRTKFIIEVSPDRNFVWITELIENWLRILRPEMRMAISTMRLGSDYMNLEEVQTEIKKVWEFDMVLTEVDDERSRMMVGKSWAIQFV